MLETTLSEAILAPRNIKGNLSSSARGEEKLKLIAAIERMMLDGAIATDSKSIFESVNALAFEGEFCKVRPVTIVINFEPWTDLRHAWVNALAQLIYQNVPNKPKLDSDEARAMKYLFKRDVPPDALKPISSEKAKEPQLDPVKEALWFNENGIDNLLARAWQLVRQYASAELQSRTPQRDSEPLHFIVNAAVAPHEAELLQGLRPNRPAINQAESEVSQPKKAEPSFTELLERAINAAHTLNLNRKTYCENIAAFMMQLELMGEDYLATFALYSDDVLAVLHPSMHDLKV